MLFYPHGLFGKALRRFIVPNSPQYLFFRVCRVVNPRLQQLSHSAGRMLGLGHVSIVQRVFRTYHTTERLI
jgi:hypothetical protein